MNFQEVILRPGQLIFGRKKAADDMPLSEQEIRTCIRFLEKIGNLTIKSTNRYSIITITNWALYQDKDQRINQNINQQLTSKQPATNQQLTTYNKDKQLEQLKTNPPIPPIDPEKPKRKKRVSELTKMQLESFLKFWAVWPKHVAQADAEKAWMKISPTNGQVEIICHAVEKWKASPKWQENNGEFIPHPATWLNGKRWRDEIKTISTQIENRIPIIRSGDNSIFADPEV